MIRINCFIYLILITSLATGNVYHCIDSGGQRIFSDKPCVDVMMGEGYVSTYEAGNLSIKKIPLVVDDMAADKIRYHISPNQIREKYCAKYSQLERNRLVQTKQIVLGMYLADVIKVWGTPIASDGNRLLFQVDQDRATISLLEGCVINIDRHYVDEEEFFNPSVAPIEDNIDD